MSADEEANKRFAVIPEEEDELERKSRVSNQDEEQIDRSQLSRRSSANNEESSNVESAHKNKSKQNRKETTIRLRSNRIGDSKDSGDSSDQSHDRNQDREILKTWRIPINSNRSNETASSSRQEINEDIDQDEIRKEETAEEPRAWDQSSPPSYKRSISHSKTNNKKDENHKREIVDEDEEQDEDYANSKELHQLPSASARASIVDRKRSSVRATEKADDDDDDDNREMVMRDSRNYHTSPEFRSTVSQSQSVDQANNNNNAIPDVAIVNMTPQVAKAENECTLEEILERYEIGDELRKKLVLLNDFKIVFILDDSSSMKHLLTESPLLKVQTRVTRWNELQYFANIALQLANFFDPDGCDVYFINKEHSLRNCKNLGELNSLFERTRPKVNHFSLFYLIEFISK